LRIQLLLFHLPSVYANRRSVVVAAGFGVNRVHLPNKACSWEVSQVIRPTARRSTTCGGFRIFGATKPWDALSRIYVLCVR